MFERHFFLEHDPTHLLLPYSTLWRRTAREGLLCGLRRFLRQSFHGIYPTLPVLYLEVWPVLMPLGELVFAALLCIPLLPTQPNENTAFRSTLACLGIVLAGVSGYFLWVENYPRLRWMSVAYVISASCWLSLATLDADSLRNGNSICENGFELTASNGKYVILDVGNRHKLTCMPGPFIWLTFADFINVCICAAVAYAWWTYATASLKGPAETPLNDPFLAAHTPGDSRPKYEHAPTEPTLQREMA